LRLTVASKGRLTTKGAIQTDGPSAFVS
jgi:hypothetical protein